MFKKIFLSYLSIMILVMTALSFVISSLAESYVYREKRSLLQNVADRAKRAAGSYAAGDINRDELGAIIDSMAYITDAKIYVVTSDIAENIDLGSELAGEYLKDAMSTVLSGGSVFQRRQYAGFGAQMLFLAEPWRAGGSIRGAVLLFSPEEDIAAVIGGIQLAVFLSAAAAALIGGVVIFLFSRRIVRPIKAMGEASSMMARGERVDDIGITTRDELGGLARSFNSMKHKIEANEALRQELIANISHDLRTPLTNINGYLSGMADGVIKEQDYPKYLGILKGETKRLMDLTGGILEAAKIRSGSIELSRETFALRETADAAAKANAELSKKNGVHISISVDYALTVHADRKKIEQVLYNLINNAVKYTPRGGLVIVSAVNTDKGSEVIVKDSGCGIDEKDLPNIFDRFYRSGSKDGFGLGLNIVNTYVEAHGGSVDITSGPEGTSVRFVLP